MGLFAGFGGFVSVVSVVSVMSVVFLSMCVPVASEPILSLIHI